jgi:pimeloyl-ACP methyl ester carboxylesterase
VHALPVEFATEQAVIDEFGPVAGRYFAEAFDRTDTGWRLRPAGWWCRSPSSGDPRLLEQWRAVRVPTLLIEAGNSVTPPGQMRRMSEIGYCTTYFSVTGAGHLVHDDAPEAYRHAVESFLGNLAR